MKFILSSLLIILSVRYNHPSSVNYRSLISHKTSSCILIPYVIKQSGYKVIGIKDGDTFVLLIDGKEQVVRLAHIDCPEKKQPFGTKAKQFASEICFGKTVTLIHNNKYDRNKRLIAEIILLNGSNVNMELVKNGLAWHFKKYSTRNEYAQLEMDARLKKIGIWSEPDPTPPWIWRNH